VLLRLNLGGKRGHGKAESVKNCGSVIFRHPNLSMRRKKGSYLRKTFSQEMCAPFFRTRLWQWPNGTNLMPSNQSDEDTLAFLGRDPIEE